MLNKIKICPKCGSSYDEADYNCPNCNTINDNGVPKSHKNMTFIPVLYQIILFVVGWMGLQTLFIIFQIIISLFFETLDLPQLAFIDFASYVFLIGALFLIFKSFLKPIFKSFKKWENYIYGIGYGVTLIITGMLYSLLISQFVNLSDNANQETAAKLVHAYPFLSILIIGITGPVCEEITYRLGLFSLLKRVNKYLPYILVPIIFGFIHFDFTCFGKPSMVNELVSIPSYIIAGLVLSLSYNHKGLACSTTAHIINNVFSIVMILIGL